MAAAVLQYVKEGDGLPTRIVFVFRQRLLSLLFLFRIRLVIPQLTFSAADLATSISTVMTMPNRVSE